MKKIFTLALGLFMTAALFAADRNPTVMLNSTRNFVVVIDGQTYSNHSKPISIDNLAPGTHSIQVFEEGEKRGIFGPKRKRLAQENFTLTDRDIIIHIKNDGQIMINERGNRNANRTDRTDRNGRNTNDDRDFRTKKEKERDVERSDDRDIDKDKDKKNRDTDKDKRNKDWENDDDDDDDEDDDRYNKNKKPKKAKKAKKQKHNNGNGRR